jgi:ketosteroid isomerase-like protein
MHPTQAKIDAAKKTTDAFLAALNAHDANAAAALYWNSPDLVLYPPHELEAHGPQQAHDSLASILQKMQGGTFAFVDPKYLVAGNDVIVYGKWTYTPPQGQVTTGRFNHVVAKKDGKWVIVLDHASVPMK